MISPGLRIGRYEIGKRLGKGGFGVVHIARDVELDRDVAIKVLKAEYQAKPQIVQRFIKEARAAAKIGHPGIVTVFECAQIQGTGTRADGNAYIAMELLVGESLGDRMLNGGRMSVPQAIAVTRQLAAALGAAHAAGIIHRDLKPDNVFLVPDAAVHSGERVKILDFGVAKLLELGEDGIITHSQMLLGTPKYMSPEQARSAAKADHRADIYTLGCMLFEMVTGRVPFGGDSGEQLLAHQKTPPPSARLVVSTVPLSIDALIRRMLAKSPDDRPQSMSEVVDALTDLTDEPDTLVRAPIETTPIDVRVSTEITTVAEPVDTKRKDHRALFIAVGSAAVVVSMLAMFFVMRKSEPLVVKPAPKATVAIDAAVEVDAPVAVAPIEIVDASAPQRDVERLRAQCLEARDAKRWVDLITCAEQLRKLDKAAGEKFDKTGHDELRAEVAMRSVQRTVADRNLTKAKTALDSISIDSVYRKDAEIAIAKFEVDLERTAPSSKKDGRSAPRDPCSSYDEIVAKARDAFASNDPSKALQHYEQVVKCKQANEMVLRLTVAAACKSRNLAKARRYWKQLTQNAKDMIVSLCAANSIYPRDLDE